VNFRDVDPESFWRSEQAKSLRKKVEAEKCGECMLTCSLGDSLSIHEFLRGGF
jgi:hypothetical protein